MKTLFMIAGLLLSLGASAQTDLERTTLDVNKQIVLVKTCSMFGGIAIIGGSVISILAAEKDVPVAEDYPDLNKYLAAVDNYDKKQKNYRVRAAALYGLGGAMILVSGIGLTQIKLRSGKAVAVHTSPDGISLAYKF